MLRTAPKRYHPGNLQQQLPAPGAQHPQTGKFLILGPDPADLQLLGSQHLGPCFGQLRWGQVVVGHQLRGRLLAPEQHVQTGQPLVQVGPVGVVATRKTHGGHHLHPGVQKPHLLLTAELGSLRSGAFHKSPPQQGQKQQKAEKP